MRSTKSPSSIERLLGLGPQPSPPNAFALDGGRLAYGRFGREPAGWRFAEYHVEPLPPDAFQQGPLGGPLRDPAVFDAVLGRLLERFAQPVEEGALVLPDAWLRLAFAESGPLPDGPRERDEVLRWKLRRLVPFRVDELRLDAVEVTPLPAQDEPRRLLLGFAIDALLNQLEEAFERAGIRIGRLTSASLAALAALTVADEGAAGDDGLGLTALALVEGGGYTLVAARGGEPVLHRYKGLAGGVPAAARGDFVRRDLMLTRNFLAESLPGIRFERVLVAAPPEEEAAWVAWLGDGLGEPARALGPGELPILTGAAAPVRGAAAPVRGAVPGLEWRQVAPLLGSVRQEIR